MTPLARTLLIAGVASVLLTLVLIVFHAVSTLSGGG